MALATIFYHLVQHLPQNQTSRQLARWRGGWRREYIRNYEAQERVPAGLFDMVTAGWNPAKIERKSCQMHFSQTHVKELLGKIRLAVQQISSGNLHFPRQVLTTSRQWRNSNPQRESVQSWNAGGSLQQHRRGKAIQPNIFIAWFTTCHALLRLYWQGLPVLNPEEVIYMDTDSIIYKRRPGVPELPTGLYLAV